jgi:hypothetical protein
VKGVAAQPGQDVAELGRQEVAAVEADHLPQLHCRAAQVGEPVGKAGEVGRRQEQIAPAWPFAGRQPPRPFSQHAARDPAGQAPELSCPRQPPAWDRAAFVPAHRARRRWRAGRTRRKPR